MGDVGTDFSDQAFSDVLLTCEVALLVAAGVRRIVDLREYR